MVEHSIKPILELKGDKFTCQFVNLDFAGGQILIEDPKLTKKSLIGKEKHLLLSFIIGNQTVNKNVPYRVCWEKDLKNGHKTIGVQFLSERKEIKRNNPRFITSKRNRPKLTFSDPLDPGRVVFTEVIDFSLDGLQVETSLSNKHLLPGMVLKNVKIKIDDSNIIDAVLKVRNARKGSDDSFILGCQLVEKNESYIEGFRKYAYTFCNIGNSDDFIANWGREKSYKSFISFEIISTEEDFEEVKKLRYLAYSYKGKVSKNSKYSSFGTTLDKEGRVFIGKINGNVICSFELRAKKFGHEFWYKEKLGIGKVEGIDEEKTLEINKMAIHPSYQKSDILLAILEKVQMCCMMYEIPEIILSSTDSLKKLYQSIGGKDLKVRSKHPTLPNTYLNLFLVSSKVYKDRNKLNPYAWELICGLQHEFAAQYGLIVKTNFSFRQKLTLKFTKLLLKFKKKRSRDANIKELSNVRLDLHPRWTEKHFSVNVIKPYIMASKRLVGEKYLEKVLTELDVSEEYFDKQTNWLSVDFFDEFIDRMENKTSIKELGELAAKLSISSEFLGEKYYLYKYFGSPKVFMKSFEDTFARLNNTRSVEPKFLSNNKIELKIFINEGYRLPKHKDTVYNFIKTFQHGLSIPLGIPEKEVKVTQITNSFDGDPYCTFIIEWKLKKNYKENILIAAVIGLFNYYLVNEKIIENSATEISVSFFGIFILLKCLKHLARYLNLRKEFERMASEYDSYQVDSREQYNHLQDLRVDLKNKYDELETILETNNLMLEENKIANILDNALSSLCSKFSFKRAIVMLYDPVEKCLKTASVHSPDKNIDQVWKFKVQIDGKRENQQVVSSVFITGNTAVINNVEEQYFQFNDASRMLIKLFETSAFLTVPIPFNGNSIGIIIADKGSIHDSERVDVKITEKDQSIIENLGKQLGIALSKQSKLDELESTLQTLKQYNPGIFEDDRLVNAKSTIGGSEKDIVCMFLDIRGFTEISETYPPETTLSILNDIFSISQNIISKYKGIIDKFIGDEVFATWDLSKLTEDESNFPLLAVEEIIEKVKERNSQYKNIGYPIIRVGAGIDYGKVIQGNIGSSERMDFTCIGSTVNRASRLQSINKELKSTIAISNSYFEKIDKLSLVGFQREEVDLRGVKDKLIVHYKRYQFEEKNLDKEEGKNEKNHRSRQSKGNAA